MTTPVRRFLIPVLSLSVLFFLPFFFAYAQTAAEIKAQISNHTEQIAALEKEITAYQKQLDVLGSQKQTLQSAIQTLDISRQKITAQISVTQNKIADANLTLTSLGSQIADKEELITIDTLAVADSLRDMSMRDAQPLVASIFSSESLSDVWEAVDADASLTRALRTHAADLANAKQVLTDRQTEVTKTKAELSSLKSTLSGQQKALDAAKQEKQTLLTQTKNQESSYQKLIAQKKAQQAAFEAELSQLENSLKSVGSASIPHVGSGVLSWPFSNTVMTSCKGKSAYLGNPFCVTQYFGTTPFATANPQVYNGSGHNGIDLGVPIGTAVQAALSGVVAGTGNTDAAPGCYSFGKWVLVTHANGLSTLYAHLSTILVAKGQGVGTGAVLGYSGMTGYATGPHLHFATYASAGVKIMTLQQYRGATSPCASATMPVAPKDAYLNPMSYL
ncbi:MAG: peptidoglycan DD-metalloendopeptidase family protein [Minisyncoccia bacterium]